MASRYAPFGPGVLPLKRGARVFAPRLVAAASPSPGAAPVAVAWEAATVVAVHREAGTGTAPRAAAAGATGAAGALAEGAESGSDGGAGAAVSCGSSTYSVAFDDGDAATCLGRHRVLLLADGGAALPASVAHPAANTGAGPRAGAGAVGKGKAEALGADAVAAMVDAVTAGVAGATLSPSELVLCGANGSKSSRGGADAALFLASVEVASSAPSSPAAEAAVALAFDVECVVDGVFVRKSGLSRGALTPLLALSADALAEGSKPGKKKKQKQKQLAANADDAEAAPPVAVGARVLARFGNKPGGRHFFATVRFSLYLRPLRPEEPCCTSSFSFLFPLKPQQGLRWSRLGHVARMFSAAPFRPFIAGFSSSSTTVRRSVFIGDGCAAGGTARSSLRRGIRRRGQGGGRGLGTRTTARSAPQKGRRGARGARRCASLKPLSTRT